MRYDLATLARRQRNAHITEDSHGAYIAAAPEQFRQILAQLRAILYRALPDAKEVVKYDMPGFQVEQTIIAGYAAFNKQCGLYFEPSAISAHSGAIASLGLKATKTGVTFSVKRPISGKLVEKASNQLAQGQRALAAFDD